MGLQPGETLGAGQSAETEADERTVDDSTAFRPASSPAAREPGGDTAPDDGDAQARTVAEPAESYTDADDVDEPIEAPPAVDANEPAGNYTNAETDQAAPVDETPAAHETWAAGTAEPVTAVSAAVGAPPAPAAFTDLDQPLLSTDTELLARWQQVQVGFINDPHAAVAGAAKLVEQAGRALVEALEERQRQMRTMWDQNSVDGPTTQRGIKADTEQMRQMMQRYQALFNQLYQPV